VSFITDILKYKSMFHQMKESEKKCSITRKHGMEVQCVFEI
jgi:hypothetical protein